MSRTQQGLVARAPKPEEAREVARLVNDSLLRQIGMAQHDPGELERMWARVETLDHLVVIERDGDIVAYLETKSDPSAAHLYFEAFTADDHLGEGLGEALVLKAIERARALAVELRKAVKVETTADDDAARALLTRHGFEVTHKSYPMFMDLEQTLPEPRWPEGLWLQPFRPGVDDETFYDVMVRGFEMWGQTTFETWRKRLQRPDFDASLWWLVQTAEGPVAALECRNQWHAQADTGWIKNLAVISGWRRRGVGRALLLHAFGEFRSRGRTRAVLGVDDDNPTQAKGFYEHIGMSQGSENTDHRLVVEP